MGKGKHRSGPPTLDVEDVIAILRENPARAVAAVAAARVLGPRVHGGAARRRGTDNMVPYDSWRTGLDGQPVAYIMLSTIDDRYQVGHARVWRSNSIPPEPLGDDPEAALKRIEDAVDDAWRASGWVLA